MNSIWRRELFTGESAHKSSAANFPAGFQTPVHAQQISPGNIDRFAIEQLAKDHAVSLQEFLCDSFYRFALNLGTQAAGALHSGLSTFVLEFGCYLNACASLHAGGARTLYDYPTPGFVHAVDRPSAAATVLNCAAGGFA